MIRQVQYTNIRDLQRNYRKISEALQKTDKPTIVMSKNEPQFALVSIKMLESLHEKTGKNSAQKLLQLAEWGEQHDFDLPKDLGENHDAYAWGVQEEDNDLDYKNIAHPEKLKPYHPEA